MRSLAEVESEVRRLAFARQIELLDRVAPPMATRRRAEIARILETAPYRDRAARA